MTQLPISNIPRVRIADARISPGLAGGPSLLGDVGRAASAVGDVLAKRDAKMAEMERLRQKTAVRSEMMIAIAEGKEQSLLVDPTESIATLNNRATKFAPLLAEVKNENDRNALTTEMDFRLRMAQIEVRSSSFKRMRDSTTEQGDAGIEIAMRNGDFETARQIAQDMQPIMKADDFQGLITRIEIAEDNAVADALKAVEDDIQANIGLFQQLSSDIDERTGLNGESKRARLKEIVDSINDSGLDETTQKELAADLIRAERQAIQNVVTQVESITTNLKQNGDLIGLQDWRRRIEDGVEPSIQRTRLLTDIDGKIRAVKSASGQIDTAMLIYGGNPVPEGTQIPRDNFTLNAVYRKGLNAGRSPEQVINRMAEVGFATPPDFRTFVNAQFSDGGDKLAGADSLRALGLFRPNEAMRIASDVGDKATTALWMVTSGPEFGLTQKTIQRVLQSDRYNAAIKESNLIAGVTTRKDDDTKPFDIEPWRIMKGEVPQSGFGRLLPGSKTGFDESKLVTNSEMRDFLNSFRALTATAVIVGDVNYNDEAKIQEIVNNATESAKKAARFDKIPLPTGPAGADIESFDMRMFGLMGEGINPGEAEGNKTAIDAFTAAIEDATTSSITGIRLGGMFSSDQPASAIAARNFKVDPSGSFVDGELVIVPLVKSDSSNLLARTWGYMEWNPKTLKHRIVLGEDMQESVIQGQRSLARSADIVGEKLGEPNEVFDDATFGRYKAIQESSGLAAPAKSLSPFAWQPSYGDMTLLEFNPDWAKGIVRDAQQKVAEELGIDASTVYDQPGGREMVFQRANQDARSAGWSSGLLPVETNDARNNDTNTK